MVENKKSRETEEKKGRVKVGNIVGGDKNKYLVVKLSEVT